MPRSMQATSKRLAVAKIAKEMNNEERTLVKLNTKRSTMTNSQVGGTLLGHQVPTPKTTLFYMLSKASKFDCWDDIWGDSACQGRSAMINAELEMTDKYEKPGGIIWAIQSVKLKEKIDVIPRCHYLSQKP